jgi:hypothetical protein
MLLLPAQRLALLEAGREDLASLQMLAQKGPLLERILDHK